MASPGRRALARELPARQRSHQPRELGRRRWLEELVGEQPKLGERRHDGHHRLRLGRRGCRRSGRRSNLERRVGHRRRGRSCGAPACGGVTDAFNALDPAVWTAVGQAQVVNGRLRVTLSGAFSGVVFATPGSFHDCFASIRLVNGGSTQEAALLIEGGAPLSSEQIGYLGATNTTTQKPATLAMAFASAMYLGIAFHGANVYFLYGSSLSWTLLTSIPRAAWMDVPDNRIGVGITSGAQGTLFIFDDFNVVPIQLADLP